ncbi:uncharacterized protein PITG_11848 [Phytophthora infestans T30-4]|uniref:Secreted protein n=2 Tax=Phytophthora infestans TaxID=4787 RepID=D0NHY6_PHYIT|nr:uncharacterized protein PITG_11848 [Phytophthora infestans T30-4]EEY58861.1 conserved hypothetical protein [Phytophthora infestans T30-4]KAF4040115.1 hypothetical protein GN244_ATG07670 [Phytophthora infestans]|eukprot:XP_002901334.1 conserved hypothetical protein [Phytophthora infestans T30-4]
MKTSALIFIMGASALATAHLSAAATSCRTTEDTDSSDTHSGTETTNYAGPISRSFQKVTSLQARVQGDMPQWDTANQRLVSEYYDTFDEKYRALLDTVNMAAIEGALKYVQAECINASVVTDCERKNGVQYVVFYQTTVVQPTAAMDFYANATDEYDFAIEHCPFLPLDGGRCNPNPDGTFPDVCNQYIGVNGQPDLGFCVGGTLQDNEVIAPYPHNYWFSFPNSCPQSRWSDKTDACRAEYAGGLCPLGVDPDGETCTFSYEVLGYIPLDDVVGITSLVNPQTNSNYANYTEFCEAGGVEFSVTVSGDEVAWLDGLEFWANPGDSAANAERAEKLVAAYGELVKTGALTSDGGVMKALPTVASLTTSNPPCYKNSKICASAEFGCKRSYSSQICEVCTSNDSGCVKSYQSD